MPPWLHRFTADVLRFTEFERRVLPYQFLEPLPDGEDIELCVYIYTSMNSIIHPFIHPSNHPSTKPFIQPSIHPSVCTFSPSLSQELPMIIDSTHPPIPPQAPPRGTIIRPPTRRPAP